VALWLMQDYPIENRQLIILDDDPTFHRHGDLGWQLYPVAPRRATISDKYNVLLDLAGPYSTDVIMVWEDDDIYLPGYVSAHVAALENAEYSKSEHVLSDYKKGQIIVEPSRGRFHSSMAFRRNLIDRVGGWPDTKRADFDQQLMSALEAEAKGVALPWDDSVPEAIPFIYRWHSGAAHCQSTMKSPDDETWYDRAAESYAEVPFLGNLMPSLDEFSKDCLARNKAK